MKYPKLILSISAAALLAAAGALADGPPVKLDKDKDADCMGKTGCQGKFNALKCPANRNGECSGLYWALIARQTTKNGRRIEVWEDTNTGLWWGDTLQSQYGYRCYGEECKTGGKYALEYDAAGNFLRQACNGDEGTEATGGTNHRAKKFAMPSVNEWQQAVADGIMQVVPYTASQNYWALEPDAGPMSDMTRGINIINPLFQPAIETTPMKILRASDETVHNVNHRQVRCVGHSP
jgi:hypothetical protein